MDFSLASFSCHDGMTSSALGIYGGDGPPSPAQQRYQSEPLSRYGSSEGSPPRSSAVASPMLLNDCFSFHAPPPPPPGASPGPQYRQISPASTTAGYGSPDPDPEPGMALPRRSLDDGRRKSSPSGRDYPVCCLHPGCTARPFKRRADLDRHYKHRHAPESQKDAFLCDYPRCPRRLDPFHRLDHFRDHLREFHKEDIEKRGGSHDDSWLGDRHVSASWWRCPKCLKRVYIDRSGYECPGCKTCCQARRKEARRRD